MDQDLNKKIEQALRLAEENNRILKRMRRSQKRTTFFRFFYWFFILSLAFGLFYYLKPFTNKIVNLFNQISGGVSNIGNFGQNLPELNNLNNLLDQMKKR